jgi:hypothetical protein
MRYLFLHMRFCTNEISFVVFALLVCRLLQKETSSENMKHCQLAAIRKTQLSKVNEVSSSYISSHQLRNAVKARVRRRGDLV